MSEIQDSQRSPSRRALLAGGAVTCAAILAGCTTHDAKSSGFTPATTGPATSPATIGPATSAGGSAPTATVLATTSQVPDGGGTIIDGKNIVITQPLAGSFKAFTALCTHEGCILSTVSGGTINCPCHGSKFSIKDGSVVKGPATTPLARVAIKVEGTSIFQG